MPILFDWSHFKPENLVYNPVFLLTHPSCPLFLLMTSTLNPQGSIQSFIILLIIRRFFPCAWMRENSQNSMICTQASLRPCMFFLIFLHLQTVYSHSSLPYRVQHCCLFHCLCHSSVSLLYYTTSNFSTKS